MRRIVIRSTAAGLALFICVIAYQCYSYAAALGKATEDVLNSWAQLNDVQSAEVSLYPWKDTKENTTFAVRHIRTFLRAYRPS